MLGAVCHEAGCRQLPTQPTSSPALPTPPVGSLCAFGKVAGAARLHCLMPMRVGMPVMLLLEALNNTKLCGSAAGSVPAQLR